MLCCIAACCIQANIYTTRYCNLVLCNTTRGVRACVEMPPPLRKHPCSLSWFSFRAIQMLWLLNCSYLMNYCEDNCKGQSPSTSTRPLCTPHPSMVGKRPQALLASGFLLLLLYLDTYLVSSFTKHIGLATKGFVHLVSVGANRSLLKCCKGSSSSNILSLLVLLLSEDSMVSI